MKTCPTCNMTVNHDDRCPFCKTSLIYAPMAHTDEEHIIFNKYYARYLLKIFWFPILCLVVCAVSLAMWHEELGKQCVPVVLLSLLSVFFAVTQRRPSKWETRAYKKEYQSFIHGFVKYLAGGFAVFLALMPWIVR